MKHSKINRVVTYESNHFVMQKNAIVSGGTGAVGTIIVDKLKGIGYNVTATLGPSDNTENSDESGINYQQLDLMNDNESKQFVEKYLSQNGNIDLLVLTVGGFSMGDLEQTTMNSINRMINLNFHTAFNLVKPAIKKMSEQETGGQIIFIGSRPAINPQEGKNVIAYSLSKSMLFSFAEILNARYQKQNIQTTVIVPSIVDTQANRNAMPEENFDNWVKTVEIADTIAFIISEAGKKLRGTNFHLYGKA